MPRFGVPRFEFTVASDDIAQMSAFTAFSVFLVAFAARSRRADLGGYRAEGSIRIAAHGSDAYVTGSTTATDFPTASPAQSTNGGYQDVFVARIGFPSGFTDDPLVPGLTIVRAVHITELRARIDALRLLYALPAFAWSDQTMTSGATPVRAVHIADLRTALAAVYAAAGKTPPTYTDPSLAGVTIRAAHVAELRAAVVALE
jgi:hypothetical protein